MDHEAALYCNPCHRDDHEAIMRIGCAEPGCGYAAKLCYASLGAHVQQRRCPRHMGREDRVIYTIKGLTTIGSYRPIPEPAQWRRCNRACCALPVRFTTYCLMCGFPEDLCPTRLDKLRLPPSNGHNEYTHCPRCPGGVGMTIVPASGYPDTDWAQFEANSFCVPDILARAGASGAWPTVREFMQRVGLTTWGTFLNNFQQYVAHIGAEQFHEQDGHGNLGRLALGHILFAEAHKLLFRRTHKCFELNYLAPDPNNPPQDPPHSFPGGRHSVLLITILRKVNDVIIQYTGRSVREFMPLDMLVLKLMASLARPGRVILIERPDAGYELLDLKALPEDESIPQQYIAKATCPAMHDAGHSWLGEGLRLFLERGFGEFPIDGVYSGLPLPFVGPLFA